MSQHPPIPGTVIFDGVQARKGYALNKMCYSASTTPPTARPSWPTKTATAPAYGLNPQQREAIRARNVLQLIAAGGNAYYLAKFAGIFGLDMQDIGAQQTGMTKEQFKAKLRGRPLTAHGERHHGPDHRCHHHQPRAGHRRRHRQEPAAGPYWKPFFDGFIPVREWLGEARPDVVVVVYNDHGLNFFLDKMPTFSGRRRARVPQCRRRLGHPDGAALQGRPGAVLAPDRTLVGEEFDLTTCQEMKVDHAFTLPMALLWPDQNWPVRVVPVCINTVQAPLPSAARCYKLGEAIGRAVASFPATRRCWCWAPAA
jgi:protocatechuate 4,5-dioxygenase alpha subunit